MILKGALIMKTSDVGAAAAMAALLFASPSAASVEDGVEVSHPEDALYCAERKLGTWFYCEKP